MIGFTANRFMENSTLQINILNPNTNTTNVSLLSDLHYPFFEYDYQIDPEYFKTITIPSMLAVNESVKCAKGILINSDHPIIVYGSNRQSGYMDDSMDDFLGIPQRALGKQYFVVTGLKRPQILVVGLARNTFVNITLKTNGIVSYQGNTYQSGQKIEEMLNEYETINIESTEIDVDLTGTKVRSTQPVSVYSGSKYSGSSYLTEQIPSTISLGIHHVTVANDGILYYNSTIVAACKDISVNITCSDGSGKFVVLPRSGSFLRMSPSKATCIISTTKPVLVAMEMHSIAQDTSMTIVQPMTRFLGDLMFLVPFITNHVHLVVVSYCYTSLSLDNVTLRTVNIDGDPNICIGRTSISGGVHVISSSEDIFFISGYLCGATDYNSIAFPLVPYLENRQHEQHRKQCQETTEWTSSVTRNRMTTSTHSVKIGSTVQETTEQTSTSLPVVSGIITTDIPRHNHSGSSCRCVCSSGHKNVNSSLTKLRKKLSIPHNMTNRHFRSLTSAGDDRSSSKMLGIAGSLVIGVVVFTIVILDSDQLVWIVRKIKRISCKIHTG
ncbi:uncharacterized protein LOC132544591 [Ylistrum balloti]|uniref:uncharacterized protein LOC132544591 n=1 Tax=Ylistrum balloti TaxID=509963 RepID=UPI002905A44B|nr:uncharacterized protein LOC132544591 [Ylistrum balloti]